MALQRKHYARRWFLALPALLIAALPLISACDGTATQAASAAPAAQTQTDPTQANIYLTIVTGDQTGKTNFPAYVPANFTVPANALVTVHVTNFDNATDVTAEPVVAVLSGTAGAETVQPMSNDNPNKLGPAQAYSRLDPAAGVSHSFSIPELGLNVPIAPNAVTTFTIRTGAKGTYAWRCHVPCGTDPYGWGGPMSSPENYMNGTMTVA